MEKCVIDEKATKEAEEARKEAEEARMEELKARREELKAAREAEKAAWKAAREAKKAAWKAARAEELAKTRWVNQRTVAFVKRPINWRNYFECHKIVCCILYYEYE